MLGARGGGMDIVEAVAAPLIGFQGETLRMHFHYSVIAMMCSCVHTIALWVFVWFEVEGWTR